MRSSWVVVVVVACVGCEYGRSEVPCDGILDPGELCDDGDSEDGDGCDCGARVIDPQQSVVGAQQPVVVVEDGAWCWFQDERVLADGNVLVIGSISHGGDIQVNTLDLATGVVALSSLHPRLERDDHDAPSLLEHDDGTLSAFYTRHDGFPDLYTRVTPSALDVSTWRSERHHAFPYDVTYSNPFQLSSRPGRTEMFLRGIDLNPTLLSSKDFGHSWSDGAQLIDAGALGIGREQRPYAKYASDGERSVHMFYTEGHPLEFGHNSVYHLVYRDGALWRSDGTRVASAGDDDQPAVSPKRGTLVFDGNQLPGGQAWTWDAAIDPDGNPVVVFATFPDPTRPFYDHRYRYARWTGTEWQVTELARGGTAIYPIEKYYSGGIALDPDDPRIVYFSSNVVPQTGDPTASGIFELYRAVTEDGQTFEITPVTSGSTVDNLRPVVPARHPAGTTLLWMRGSYDSYLEYRTQIVALVGDAQAVAQPTPPAPLDLTMLARFDLAATVDGPPTPPAPGFVAAVPEGGFAQAADGGVTLTVSNITGTIDSHMGDPLYRGAVICNRGGYSPDKKLHVAIEGLVPGETYVVRIHAHDDGGSYLQPTLWFLDTAKSLIAEHNERFVAGHRNVNATERGEGVTDVLLSADDSGRIGLVARGLNETDKETTAVLAGLEVFPRPPSVVVAAFDMTAPGREPMDGAAPLWFDDAHEWSASASQNGIDLRVTSDRILSLRTRDVDDPLADLMLGRDQLVADLAGLEVGALYEITVYSTDLESSMYNASRWSLEETGREPIVVRGLHINFGLHGPGASFTFFHRATTPGFRLRAEDVLTSLSSDPSYVLFNALEIRRVQ